MARSEQEGHEPTVCRRHQSGHRQGRVLRHRVRPRLRRLLPTHGAQHPHVALRLTSAHHPSPGSGVSSRGAGAGLFAFPIRGSLGGDPRFADPAPGGQRRRPLGVTWGPREQKGPRRDQKQHTFNLFVSVPDQHGWRSDLRSCTLPSKHLQTPVSVRASMAWKRSGVRISLAPRVNPQVRASSEVRAWGFFCSRGSAGGHAAHHQDASPCPPGATSSSVPCPPGATWAS